MIMPVSVSCTLLPRCSCSAIAIAAYTSLFFIINIVYSAPPQSGEGAMTLHRNISVLLGRQGVALGGEPEPDHDRCGNACYAVRSRRRYSHTWQPDTGWRRGSLYSSSFSAMNAFTSSPGFLLGLGLLGIQHGSSTAGTHHGDLSRRPCVVQVGVEPA